MPSFHFCIFVQDLACSFALVSDFQRFEFETILDFLYLLTLRSQLAFKPEPSFQNTQFRFSLTVAQNLLLSILIMPQDQQSALFRQLS